MDIQLKKLQVNLAFSEETTMFKADIYIDRYKAGYASNDGQGGNTYYHFYNEKGRQLIKQAEIYCKGLPQIEFGDMKWDMTFEQYIDKIVNDKVEEKERAKFINKRNKACLNSIVYCLPSDVDKKYQTIKWKGHTIETLLKHPKGPETLNKKIQELKTKGYNILNKNILV